MHFDLFCESCANPHEGVYASGRFCSEKCARSFSTEANRKDISKRVSDTLKKIAKDHVPVEVRSKILEATSKHQSMAESAIEVGVHYLTFRKYAKRLGVWNAKSAIRERRPAPPLEDVLKGMHPEYGAGCVKKRLLKEGVKSKTCEDCNISEWRGLPIVIELDHINGNSKDHRLENLRMLCPNCHSQTPTFRARNKRKGRHND